MHVTQNRVQQWKKSITREKVAHAMWKEEYVSENLKSPAEVGEDKDGGTFRWTRGLIDSEKVVLIVQYYDFNDITYYFYSADF